VINDTECHIINGECDTYFGYSGQITPPGSFVCAEIVGFGVERLEWVEIVFNPISSNSIHFVRDFKNLATIRS
jgi:hypothetical protein